MPDEKESKCTMWIWLACLGLGAAFTAVAAQLAVYVVTGKHVMYRSDSIDDAKKIDITGTDEE